MTHYKKFTFEKNDKAKYKNVIAEFPHGGENTPMSLFKALGVEHSRKKISELLQNYKDEGTEIFYKTLHENIASFLISENARAFLDNNRPETDPRPDGTVKEEDSLGNPIYKKPPSRTRKKILERTHHIPYLKQLKSQISTLNEENPEENTYMIFGHTMDGAPTHSATTEHNEKKGRPLIAFSNGKNHENGIPKTILLELQKRAQNHLDTLSDVQLSVITGKYNQQLKKQYPNERRKFRPNTEKVGINSPYSGATSINRLTPAEWGQTKAILVEVNKAMLTTEKGIEIIQKIMTDVAQYLSSLQHDENNSH